MWRVEVVAPNETLHRTGHAIDGAPAPAYPPAWAGR
jgi:hypothetical protein